MRTLINLALTIASTALALWVVVALVPGITLDPQGSSEGVAFVVVAAAFVVVNAVLGTVLHAISWPLSCVTLGLFALVVNGAVLLAVPWVLDQLALGRGTLVIDGWWAAIFGAAILGLTQAVIGMVTAPAR